MNENQKKSREADKGIETIDAEQGSDSDGGFSNVEHDSIDDERDHLLANSPSLLAAPSQTRDTVLFFFSAVGCTIGWTAVLSNLVFYSDRLGLDSYLYLNLAVYSPLLPISTAQALWDSECDRRYSSMRSFSFRGLFGFSLTLVCTLMLPVVSDSLPLLFLASLFLGLSSAVLHGTLKQLASIVYPNCGQLAAAVTAGMQASAVFVLMITFGSNFGRTDDKTGIVWFYFAVAIIVLFCGACFGMLMMYSHNVAGTMLRRDSSFRSPLAQPLLFYPGEESSSSPPSPPVAAANRTGELDLTTLFLKTWPACLTIGMTVASSMSVSSLFNRVPSQDPTNEALPQVLFYTRLFADLIGRPASLYCSPDSLVSLTVLSILRLGFLPLFFLYTSSSPSIIPKNDMVAIAAVFLFAFSSGMIATRSYQLAPVLLDDHEREQNTVKQASLVNVCFSASILFGVMASFLVK